MSSLLVKAEASPMLGGGHIFRCMSLARYFKSQGWHCTFLCDAQTLKTVPMLSDQGFSTILADNEKPLPDIVGDHHYDLMVFDQYDVDIEYEKSWRAKADKILVIDDLANRNHDCDYLLDQNFFPDMAGRYTALVSDATQTLLGPDYALLRPFFADVRPSVKPRQSLRRVFVCFGATDPKDMTSLAIEALGDFIGRVDVVIGLNSPNLAKVREICASKPRVHLHINAEEAEMIDLMCDADLAISAGGTMSWERCALGLPTLVVTIADNQLEITEHLAARDVVKYVGHFNDVNADMLKKAVQDIQANPETLKTLSENAMKMCDGSGCEKVYEKITS